MALSSTLAPIKGTHEKTKGIPYAQTVLLLLLCSAKAEPKHTHTHTAPKQTGITH